MKAMTLPVSSPEPPPKAITPSCPPARSTSTPAVTFAEIGLGFTSEKTPTSNPASRNSFNVFCVTGRLTRPASVTSSGFDIPAVRSASGSSTIRPAPNLMAVG